MGKLINNPKAGDEVWIGVEWDLDDEQGGPGRHMGIVDGVKYFELEHHVNHPKFASGDLKVCSFLRYSKTQIGGINMEKAIHEQYQSQDDLDEEAKQVERQKEMQDLIVSTNSKGGFKKIEVLGVDKSYNWRSDISKSRDITLQFLKISEIGPFGCLRNLIPSCMHLYLDKNLLYSWDQYFQIIRELPYLRILALTGNKFRKLPKNYFEDKSIEALIPTHLHELVLIDMSLDWG